MSSFTRKALRGPDGVTGQINKAIQIQRCTSSKGHSRGRESAIAGRRGGVIVDAQNMRRRPCESPEQGRSARPYAAQSGPRKNLEVESKVRWLAGRDNNMSSVSNPRAVSAAFPGGGLVGLLGQNAEPANTEPASNLPSTQRHFDVCPIWLELAIRHLSDAQVAQAARVETWKDTDEPSKTGALEWEFEASIQAIVMCGMAIEAFYAVVQTIIHSPQSLIDEWRDERTPRYIQICEVLRRAFSLEPKTVSSLRQTLGEIFRFRDLAIDPCGKMDTQVLHPELGIGVEWRFAYFRYENALLIVRATLQLIGALVGSGKPKDADLQKYIDTLRWSVESLQNRNVLSGRKQEPYSDPRVA